MSIGHLVRNQYPNATARSAWTIVTLVFLVALSLPSVQAQFTISSLGTFGSNGWLAPNGYNGSTYTYLTASDPERGLAFGNQYLYLVSRYGGDFVRVLDAQNGQDIRALNMGTGEVAGGTFDVNMVAVGEDGAIYVANLSIGPASFKRYRWTNDAPTTLLTLVYNGVPLAGGRLGNTLSATGSGKATRLVAGFNSIPNVSGNNGYAHGHGGLLQVGK